MNRMKKSPLAEGEQQRFAANLFVTFGDRLIVKTSRSDSRYALLSVSFGDFERRS